MDRMETLNNLKESQKTIDVLLKLGSLSIKGAEQPGRNPWQLEPLFNSDKCNVGVVHIKDVEAGPCEEHIHVDSKEYLIVTSGSVMLNINGKDVRVLHTGDCGVVNPGEGHYSRPLEDGTQMIYICVPADSGMDNLYKTLGQDYAGGEGNN